MYNRPNFKLGCIPEITLSFETFHLVLQDYIVQRRPTGNRGSSNPIRGWSRNRILCSHFLLPSTYWELVQLALEKPRSSVYSFLQNFDCKHKKQKLNNLQSQLEYRHSPRGIHMSQKRWGELQARLDINHPIPTLHTDSCFQWIVAWYSWYHDFLTSQSARAVNTIHCFSIY